MNQSPDVAVMDSTVRCGIRFTTAHVVAAQLRMFSVLLGVFVTAHTLRRATPADAVSTGEAAENASSNAVKRQTSETGDSVSTP